MTNPHESTNDTPRVYDENDIRDCVTCHRTDIHACRLDNKGHCVYCLFESDIATGGGKL